MVQKVIAKKALICIVLIRHSKGVFWCDHDEHSTTSNDADEYCQRTIMMFII